jgi:hypothetical protein
VRDLVFFFHNGPQRYRTLNFFDGNENALALAGPFAKIPHRAIFVRSGLARTKMLYGVSMEKQKAKYVAKRSFSS